MIINTLLLPFLFSATAFASHAEPLICKIPASPTTCFPAPNEIKLPQEQIEIANQGIAICKAAPEVPENPEQPKDEQKVVRLIDKGGRVHIEAPIENPENNANADPNLKQSDLFNTSWSLISITTDKGEQALPEKHQITLIIDEKGAVSGNAGVNRYFGSMKADGQKISWSPIGSTRKGGPKDLMDAESLFLKSISSTTSYELKDGNVIFSDEATKTKVVMKAAKADE